MFVVVKNNLRSNDSVYSFVRLFLGQDRPKQVGPLLLAEAEKWRSKDAQSALATVRGISKKKQLALLKSDVWMYLAENPSLEPGVVAQLGERFMPDGIEVVLWKDRGVWQEKAARFIGNAGLPWSAVSTVWEAWEEDWQKSGMDMATPQLLQGLRRDDFPVARMVRFLKETLPGPKWVNTLSRLRVEMVEGKTLVPKALTAEAVQAFLDRPELSKAVVEENLEKNGFGLLGEYLPEPFLLGLANKFAGSPALLWLWRGLNTKDDYEGFPEEVWDIGSRSPHESVRKSVVLLGPTKVVEKMAEADRSSALRARAKAVLLERQAGRSRRS
jgi:hypothetical protein